MKVVILAGGFGTRIGEETHQKPKPMIRIGEQPILWHIMKYCSSFGMHEFVICCGYKGEQIKKYFADYFLCCSDVTFDFSEGNRMILHRQTTEPWKVTLADTGLYTQTGGRIARIRQYVEDSPFLLTYGDGVSDVDLDALLACHKKSGKAVTVTAIRPQSRFGVLRLNEKENAVTGFREKGQEEHSWVNGGFMVAEQELFGYLSERETCILECEPMEELAAKGRLGCYRHTGFWQCMDTPGDKKRLEELWKSGRAPWKRW